MSQRVTCTNCGFLNEPGDEFCGDCGTYLAWSGAPDGGPANAAAAADAAPFSAAGPPPGPPPPVPAGPPPPLPVTPPTPMAPPPAQSSAPVYQAPIVQQPPPPPYPQGYQFMPPPAMGGQPCRNCGLLNPAGRSFCQRCGQRLDPAVGTVAGAPRPAPGPASATATASSGGGGKRLAIAGIAAIFIAAVAGAALILSGALGGNKAVSPTPITALASSTPAATDQPTPEPTTEPAATPDRTPRPTKQPVPTDEATPLPTDAATPEPTVAPTPQKTPRPTKQPTPAPPAPSQAPPPAAYVCDTDTTITDPLSAGWNIRRIDWSNQGKYDRLVVTLDQRAPGGDGTQAITHVMPPTDVPTTLKVTAPQAGQVAIALGLFQDVRLTWSLDRALTLPALKWITMEKDDNGFPWVVLGVKGAGCYSLQVPDWSATDPQPASTVLVTIDVKH